MKLKIFNIKINILCAKKLPRQLFLYLQVCLVVALHMAICKIIKCYK